MKVIFDADQQVDNCREGDLAAGNYDIGWGGEIVLCTHKQYWHRLVRVWGEAPQFQNRVCALMDLACTLLHELVHVVTLLEDHPKGDFKRECNAATYPIENAFRWGLLRRYSFVTEDPEGSCCSAHKKVAFMAPCPVTMVKKDENRPDCMA